MTLFDFTFGLNAVILGLALAEMATRFQQLVFAGRRVKWAPEPVILSLLIFMVILVVWLGRWGERGMRETTVGEVALQLLAVIAPYMVAATVLPKPPEEGAVDLHAYYDRGRLFLFGTLLVGQLLSWAMIWIHNPLGVHGLWEWTKTLARYFPYYDIIPYALLMFVRWRWLNIAALLFVGALFLPSAFGIHLRG